jgi:hypothetical protein
MIKKYFMALMVLASSVVVQASGFSSHNMDRITDQYFERLFKVMSAGSSEKDVQALFGLMHDDVRYEHFEYEANFNREEWYQAFLANLERGAYQMTVEERIVKTNVIYGKSHAAVEYRYANKDEKLLILFGFQDGQIILVRELW